ncbi:MAG: SIS domain-containing protein [Candidatus Woesearchaeota archaeon]|nr:SIS domain-containing protein [Candidatus Woesearchaeota archaeon]
MEEIVKECIQESIRIKEKILNTCVPEIIVSAKLIIEALRKGKKILICGNGGSAADSQHFVAELIVRFEKNRVALPAIALTTNSSNLTACSNDFSFKEIFSRQVNALGSEGDVFLGISTSGNSSNVLLAFEHAKKQKMLTIGLSGNEGGELKKTKA